MVFDMLDTHTGSFLVTTRRQTLLRDAPFIAAAPVPEAVIRHLAAKLEPPDLTELHRVQLIGASAFLGSISAI